MVTLGLGLNNLQKKGCTVWFPEIRGLRSSQNSSKFSGYGLPLNSFDFLLQREDEAQLVVPLKARLKNETGFRAENRIGEVVPPVQRTISGRDLLGLCEHNS